MTVAIPPATAGRVGRLLVLSAIVMFALAVVFWNDLLPLGISADARPVLAGALAAAGVLDLGLALFMKRRAR
jgi:hypothetical protein